MNKYHIYVILLTILFVISSIVSFVFLSSWIDDNMNQTRKKEILEYPSLSREFDKNYEGTISHKKLSRGFGGYYLFTLINGIRFGVSTSYHYNYKPYDLLDFIEVGDSINKPANNDTLFIYRDNKEYFFVSKRK